MGFFEKFKAGFRKHTPTFHKATVSLFGGKRLSQEDIDDLEDDLLLAGVQLQARLVGVQSLLLLAEGLQGLGLDLPGVGGVLADGEVLAGELLGQLVLAHLERNKI